MNPAERAANARAADAGVERDTPRTGGGPEPLNERRTPEAVGPEDFELQDSDAGQEAAAICHVDRRAGVVPIAAGPGGGPAAGPGVGRAGRDGVIRSGKLAGLSMWAAIWVLSWPVLVESFLNAMVGFVDTALAARLSAAATSAIGIASYFHWFTGLLAVSLGVGATAMVSRAVARGRGAVAGAVSGQVVLLSVVFGTAMGVLIGVLAPQIGLVTGLERGGEALAYAVDYLRWIALGVPFVTVMFAGMACLRGAGDSLKPLWVMVGVNVINVAVSFLLSGVDITAARTLPGGEVVQRILIANPSPLDMGVRGIALGTLAAWIAGAAFVIAILFRGTHGLKMRARRLRPHWHTARRLIRVALPNFFETVGMWVGNFLTVLMVGLMGNELYHGAHIVAIRIEAFSFLPGFAMATCAATLAGQYLGAGSEPLARRAVLRCTAVAASLMGLLGLAFIGVPRSITKLFSDQALHLELVPPLLIVCGLVQIPFAIAIVVRGALRGAGDTRAVMLLTWISTWGVRLPAAWLCCGIELPLPGGGVIPNPAPLQEHFGIHPLVGLWIGMCGELAFRCVLFLGRFAQGRWASVRV